MEKSVLTGWRLGCPNCGEMIAASASQNVHHVHDLHAAGRVYAQLTTVCMHCHYPLTEIFTIN
jgi:C4-type Zn-finger protein